MNKEDDQVSINLSRNSSAVEMESRAKAKADELERPSMIENTGAKVDITQ
jgi:hypothetical protein